jgi:hypothetical protein
MITGGLLLGSGRVAAGARASVGKVYKPPLWMGVNHWHAQEPSDYIPQPCSSSTWPLVSFIYHGSGWVTRVGAVNHRTGMGIISDAWRPHPLLILNNAMGKVNKQAQWGFTQGWGFVNHGGIMGIKVRASLPPPPIN